MSQAYLRYGVTRSYLDGLTRVLRGKQGANKERNE